ncbi:MAG: hypothetical protein US68_C0002G0008 [Candidatus Shapirobacteria bacterium GW2011_GWE1_38_10]|uniref:Uncharacterized protein n=1 Tax=Candidatus Shapirobacteria bacterium GW2011_GWE1_38_10 TaxID=1618488 RepID=A0A0G0LDL5_9BACT|nr:MAG: hypothetical protein US46_C0010G0002 [Candidatus Shapirobacteria bacterium GW2011_GWF2_37_20]KKQ50731.1 MAG: hypothetical protein US68_C0002G0008 [Candidatus Shapirobacteria bacterium GW2011_GWE1_38_10]KKQ64481.1 MAG: hypothetical protein US85_C0008G0010 [Candidatus Shapirobacteria bacterium GW2011_GWF1_38_23]HBP51269.1 hypothetical protein [Candidatus Shapirobacteria bacterium]
MDIPNLSPNPSSPSPLRPSLSLKIVAIILILALSTGFWASRLFPFSKSAGGLSIQTQEQAISTEDIQNKDEIKANILYGDTATIFKDSATGTIEKGSINGVGTHILNREGGVTQRASLTSSVVDLDLFVGRKVEVKGETNSSSKTAWLMDVGSIKVIE